MDRISASQRDSFPVLFGDDWQAGARHLLRRLRTPPPGPAERFWTGRRALLDACQPLLTSLVSNKSGRHLRKEAEHLGWTSRFHALVGATDAEKDKPDPAPVHLALQGTGIAPGPDVWFIGDSGTDLKTARATGCTAVILTHAAANPAALPADLSADLTVPHLAALQQALVESMRTS